MHLLEWLPSKRQEVSAGKDTEKREPVCTVDGNVNWYNHYRGSSKHLKIELPYYPAIPLLGIHLKEMK